MIIVTAKVQVTEENQEAFRTLVASFENQIRQDEGCISAQVFQDCEEKGTYLFYEKWATQEDWQEHMQTSHVQEFLGRRSRPL